MFGLIEKRKERKGKESREVTVHTCANQGREIVGCKERHLCLCVCLTVFVYVPDWYTRK